MRVVLYWETRRTILLLLRRLTRYRTSDSLLWEPARPELAGAAFVPNLQVSVRAQRGEVFRWSLAFAPDARLLHGVVLGGRFCDERVPFLAVHRVPVVDQEFAAGQLDRARAVGRLVEDGASVGYFGRLKLGRCVSVQLHYSVCPSSTSNNWSGKTALSVVKDGFAVFSLLSSSKSSSSSSSMSSNSWSNPGMSLSRWPLACRSSMSQARASRHGRRSRRGRSMVTEHWPRVQSPCTLRSPC